MYEALVEKSAQNETHDEIYDYNVSNMHLTMELAHNNGNKGHLKYNNGTSLKMTRIES